MRRFLAILLLIVLLLTGCSNNAGKTDNATINLGESEKFSEEEIEAATDCVIKTFKDFEGCELLELWYDEDDQVDGYYGGGRDSIYDVEEQNVIVLMSNFYVDSSGKEIGLNPDSTQSYWQWILVRDSENDDWLAADWGY